MYKYYVRCHRSLLNCVNYALVELRVTRFPVLHKGADLPVHRTYGSMYVVDSPILYVQQGTCTAIVLFPARMGDALRA